MFSRVRQFATVSLLALVPAPVLAQETDDAAEEAQSSTDAHQIVVIAGVVKGAVDAPQKPVMVLGEEDIAAYGASSLSELVAALAPQTGSGRGRGGHPVILFNGQRISDFREFRNIPPEAIKRMEILPEEVALRFGFPPDARVINFILRDNFAARTIAAEYNAPTRGGFAQSEIEATLLAIGKANRVNLNFVAKDASLLSEAERALVQDPASQPGAADPARYRSLLPDSRSMTLTGSLSRVLGAKGTGGTLSANASIARADSRSLAGLDPVALASPGATVDPLERETRTVTLAGGAAWNRPLGRWQMAATVNASHVDSESSIDRRREASALVDPGADRAKSRTGSINSLLTFSGSPFRLPAGEASATLKAGYEHSAITSRDTRIGSSRTSLSREDRYAGVNLSLPLTSVRDGVLAGIGDVALNFSAGVADLSDFGGLADWSAGLTWAPTEKLGLQASYMVDQSAPELTDLGNPLVQSFNVPVYDFARGETVLVTVTSGGNPALAKEKRRDLKLGANWQLPFLANSNLIVEWFRNRSNDVTTPFPALTPEIEAAFPGRAVRDVSGRLVAIDRRPVTLAETSSQRLRWGFNLSGTLGKADPAGGGARGGGMGMMGRPAGPAAGGPRMGAGGPGGPGGMMAMMGGRGGQGRWNLSLYHTIRIADRVLVARGGPVLDLLHGDALSGGGSARHSLELEGGGFYRGFGLRMNGSWSAPTHVRASGAPGTSDLRFGSVFMLNLRAFVDFDRQPAVLKAMPFLKGFRLALVADNALDSRQKVTDASGATPLGYQKAYLDPRGRFLGIDIRKVF